MRSFMNIISKIGTAPVSLAPQKANDPASPAVQPQTKSQQGTQVPPSFSTAALSVPGNVDTTTIGNSEAQLRRQGLECLVAALKSLVAWGTASTSPPEQTQDPTTRSQLEESRRDTLTPDISTERLSPGAADVSRGQTPELADDPSKFESAKQKKTTLLEGIKKFNFKPKRVGDMPLSLDYSVVDRFVFRVSSSSLRLGLFLVEIPRTSRGSCSTPMVFRKLPLASTLEKGQCRRHVSCPKMLIYYSVMRSTSR